MSKFVDSIDDHEKLLFSYYVVKLYEKNILTDIVDSI